MSNVDWFDANAIEKSVKMNDSKNCPNCGAPIDSEKCSFCGTRFIDFAAMNADEPFFLKIKKDGMVFVAKVMMNSASVENETTSLYADNRMMYSRHVATEITLNFTVVH